MLVTMVSLIKTNTVCIHGSLDVQSRFIALPMLVERPGGSRDGVRQETTSPKLHPFGIPHHGTGLVIFLILPSHSSKTSMRLSG